MGSVLKSYFLLGQEGVMNSSVFSKGRGRLALKDDAICDCFYFIKKLRIIQNKFTKRRANLRGSTSSLRIKEGNKQHRAQPNLLNS
jgi:hypothetical protein